MKDNLEMGMSWKELHHRFPAEFKSMIYFLDKNNINQDLLESLNDEMRHKAFDKWCKGEIEKFVEIIKG